MTPAAPERQRRPAPASSCPLAFTGRLDSDYFTLAPLDDEESVTAQLPYGAWIRLFRRSALIVEDLVELRAPAEPSTTDTE